MRIIFTAKEKIYGAIAYATLVVFIFALPLFREFDLRTLDVFQTNHSPHPDIVIVAIDNKSIEELGRWPWTRSVHASLLEKLAGYDPRLVAFDVVFSEAENNDADRGLTTALASARFPIVLAGESVKISGDSNSSRELLPLARFRNTPNVRVGFVNAEADLDGRVRRLVLKTENNDTRHASLALVAAEALAMESLKEGKYNIAFAGPAGTFPTFSASDVLNGKIPAGRLKDAVVLVGATASDLHDTVTAPPGLLAGVEFHANALDNLLLKRPVLVLPGWLVRLAGAILATLLLLYVLNTTTQRAFFAAAFLTLAFPATSYLLWTKGFAAPFFANTSLAIATFVILSLFRWYRAEQDKKKLRERFQNYFSPRVLQSIIADPSYLTLGGTRRDVTILFSDIRSFTTITENTSPEALTRILHRYFTEMTEEIFSTDGVLDKFIGDAIMAFWGAPIEQPDHPVLAVRAAIGMMRRLKKLQAAFAAEGLPLVDIGIGINTGPATVGNMGSERRFDYTVIGDSVNAASRLEGLNKEYKTHIIISRETEKHLPAEIKRRRLGEVTVKGKTQGIEIFEVIVEG